MGTFKEISESHQIEVPPEVAWGGVYFGPNGAEYSVRHPNFRLRGITSAMSTHVVCQSDIDPIKIQPSPNTEGWQQEVKVPASGEVSIGLEAEFIVIDRHGNPVDLYNGDCIHLNGKGPEVHIKNPDATWLIDELGLSPEGLKFQAELGTKPANAWQDLHQNILDGLRQAHKVCKERGLYLLPVGLSGMPLEKIWGNIPPHPYMVSIHSFGLRETALDWDPCTVQTHTDLRPFGPAEFGLYAANVGNNLLFTMEHALSVSAPFNKGRITQNLSNRERVRNRLSTVGGVQANIPESANKMLEVGDTLIRQGAIPVPERAFGSHKDTRPVKFTTGTFEVGSADSCPNIDMWIALAVINREFLIKLARDLQSGKPVPEFLVGNNFQTRKENRAKTSRFGNNATLATPVGEIPVAQAWDMFFSWIEEDGPTTPDWQMARSVVITSLTQQNVAAQMLEYAGTKGNEVQRIKRANLQVAKEFMDELEGRINQ